VALISTVQFLPTSGSSINIVVFFVKSNGELQEMVKEQKT